MNQTGTDTEVEIYSYLTGMLTRSYAYEYHHTVQTVRNTLEKLKIPIKDTIADGLKTEFTARRADETPVAIEIVLIDRDHTQVSVSTGTVGVWDRRVSEQIQGYIAEALDQKMIDDEKLPEDSTPTEAQPVTGEAVQPEIVEEDLAEDSESPTVQTGTPGHQILPDSPNVIFFGNDSNELSGAAIEKLDRIYEILTNNPEAEVMLNGYSDSYGSPSYNQMISEIRANAVKSYLIGKGIDSSRIMALGYGSQKFIASNKTREGRGMNRRVEVEIVGLKNKDVKPLK